MKTCMEWLETLPEPYRSQAIENCNSEHNYTGNAEVESLRAAILSSFVFFQSKEGSLYWAKFTNTIQQ